MPRNTRSVRRKLVASVTSLSVALQPLAATAETYFYRQVNPGAAVRTPATDNASNPPGAGQNTVKGTGDIEVYAAASARARPGVAFGLAPFAKNPNGGAAWANVGSALPAGLTVSPATGAISGTPTDGSAGSYGGIKLQVTDSTNRTGSTQPIAVTVVPRPSVTVQAATTVAVGGTVSIVPQVTDALGSQTWSLRGTLPSGLSFNPATGAISGATRQAGTFANLVLGVTDSDGARGSSAPFSLNITSTVAIGGLSANYGMRLDRAMTAIQPSLSGAVGSVTWSLASGTLPPGLSLGMTDGRVTGTPTKAGTYAGIALLATDNSTGEGVASAPFSLTVASTPTVVLAPLSYLARQGAAVAVAPQASGLVGAARWMLQGGSLPAGLSFDPATGAISGSPAATVRLAGLTIRVVDLYDGTSATTQPFALQAYGTLALADTAGATAGIGEAFTLSPPKVSNLGGTASWSLEGTLPAGLTFDPATGRITGTPTASGQPAPLRFAVKDSLDGATAKGGPFTVTVPAPGTVAVTGIDGDVAARTGQAFSLTPGLVGAKRPAAWSVSSLPSWAAFDAGTGAITGTPGAPEAPVTVQLTVQDSTGKTATSPSFVLSTVQALSVAYAPGAASQGRPFDLAPTVAGASGAVSYSLASGALPEGLSLDRVTGRISGTTFAPGAYTLSVAAADGAVGVTSNVFVLGVAADGRSASIPAAPAGQPGTALAIQAEASGFDGAVTWSVASGTLPAWASLSPATGAVTGTPTEVGYFGPVVLEATDASGAKARTNAFTVAVTQNPVLSATVNSAVVPVGAPFTLAPQATNTQGVQRWTLASGTLPTGLGLDGNTGVISGTPTVPGAAANLSLRVADVRNTTVTSPFSITVSAQPALAIRLPSATASATVGTRFATPRVTVENAVDGFTVALSSGTLPAWATLDAATGSISGTPPDVASIGATAGIRLVATDGSGRTVTSDAITISVSRKEMTAAGATGFTLRPGTAYVGPAPQASGNLGTVTWSVSPALPSGLSLDPATGVVSGTPGQVPAGSVPHVLTAIDGADQTKAAAGTFYVTILGAPVVGVTAENTMRHGVVNTLQPTVSEVARPLTWTLAAGTLPPGLALDAATGTVSGTPTALGTTGGLRLAVRDAQGGTATSEPFSIEVDNSLLFSFAPVAFPYPAQRVTVPWTSPGVTVVGAIGKTTFALASGTLPAGLTLDANTGQVSGTATAAFSGSVTIRAVDSTGEEATSKPLDVSMGAAPTVAQADLSVRVGAPVQVAPAVANVRTNPETGTYSLSLSGGTLPAGLALGFVGKSVTYYLNGTPTVPASLTGLRLTARDADGAVGTSEPFSLTVAPGISVAGLQAGYTGRVGMAFAGPFEPTVSNAKGKVAWSVDRAPAGLTLDPATGKLTGTPTAAFSGPVKLTAVDDFDGAVSSAQTSIAISQAILVSGARDLSTHVGVDATTRALGVTGQRGSSLAWSSTGAAMPAYATVDPATGIVSLRNPTLGKVAGLTLQARDPVDGATGTSAAFAFDVVPFPSVSNVATSYVARLGFPFRTVAPTLDNAIGAVSWSIGAGTLPPWARVEGDGSLTGTPSGQADVGVSTGIKLAGTDSTGTSAPSAAFSIGVYAQPAVNVASSRPSGQMRVGDALTLTPTATGLAGAGSWQVDVASGALPAGLSMADPATGVVSGTVTAPGTADLALTVTDSADGQSASSPSLSLTASPALRMAAIPDYTVHANQTFITTPSPAATGLVGTASYALSAAVPGGMNPYDTATGVLSGLPSAPGTTRYTATVTDGFDGRTASTTFVVTVVNDLRFTTDASDLLVAVGSNATLAPVVSNAIGAVSYALRRNGADAPTALAACTGIAFSPTTGGISGKATAPCSVDELTIVATDDTQSAATAPFKVAIAAADVTLASSGLTVQEGSTATLQATTNLADATWTISGAPAGSSVSPTGLVSVYGGDVEPTQASTVTVTATSGPYSNAKTFALSVQAAAATVATPQAVRAGTAFTASVATTMTAPGTWTATALPADVTGLAVTGSTLGGTAPAVAGTSPVTRALTATYTANDAPSGSTAAKAVGGAVLTVQPRLAIGAAAVAGTVGTPLAAAAPSPANKVGTLSYALLNGSTDVSATLGTLCNGLSFSTATGTMSGTPAATCSQASLTLKARDDGNGSPSLADDATATLSIAVTPATATASNYAPSVVEGSSVTLTASSSLPSPVYSLTGAPPAWLSVNPSTGAVSGVSADVTSDASYVFQVKATAGAYSASSPDVTLAVRAASATVPALASAKAGGSITTTATSTFAGGATYAFSAFQQDGTTPATDVTFTAQAGGSVTVNVAASANPGATSVTRYVAVTATSTATPSTGTAATATSAKVPLTVLPTLAISMASQTPAAGSTTTLAPSVTNLTGTPTYTLLQSGSPNPAALSACGYAFNTATGQMTTTGATACNVGGLSITVASSDGPTATSSPAFSVIVTASAVPLAAVTPPNSPGNGSGTQSFPPLTATAAISGGNATYNAFYDNGASTYAALTTSQRIAYYYSAAGVQTDCVVLKGAPTGGTGAVTATFYLGTGTVGSVSGNVVAGQFTQAVLGTPVAKTDSLQVLANAGTVNLAEFRLGNMSGGVCVQPGTGGVPTPNYAFSADAQSFAATPGSTATMATTLSGTPSGAVTWTLADASGAAPPSWITMTGCSGNQCTVTAAPGTGVVSLANYPSSGAYYLTATDSGGAAVRSAGFVVNTLVPKAATTPPNSPGTGTGDSRLAQYWPPYNATAATSGVTSYQGYYDDNPASYASVSTSARIAYYYDLAGMTTDCMVTRGTATGGTGTVAVTFYTGPGTVGSASGSVVSGKYVQTSFPAIAKADSMDIRASTGSFNLAEFRFGNLVNGVCTSTGAGGVTSGPVGYSVQPASSIVAGQGQSPAPKTTATLSGVPAGTLSWSIVDANNNVAPAWMSLSACGTGTNASCTATAAPAAATATGTFTYYLAATDSSNGVQYRSNAIAVKVTPSITNARPVAAYQTTTTPATSSCADSPASCTPLSVASLWATNNASPVFVNKPNYGIEFVYQGPVAVGWLTEQLTDNCGNGQCSGLLQYWDGSKWVDVPDTTGYWTGSTITSKITASSRLVPGNIFATRWRTVSKFTGTTGTLDATIYMFKYGDINGTFVN